jgi:hypothetical protein
MDGRNVSLLVYKCLLYLLVVKNVKVCLKWFFYAVGIDSCCTFAVPKMS